MKVKPLSNKKFVKELQATKAVPLRFDEHQLAPVVLITLFHVHVDPSPLHESLSTQASINVLKKYNLIEPSEDTDHGWRTTPRGAAYIIMLCRMPFPVPSPGWVNPLTNEPIPNKP